MTGTDIRQAHSGIKVNVGCGLSPTYGWLNFDNSLSVRVARFPVISSVLRRMGLLTEKSAQLAEMGQAGSIRFANAAVRIPCAAVVPPGATRIDEPGQLDLHERATESVYVEAVRAR